LAVSLVRHKLVDQLLQATHFMLTNAQNLNFLKPNRTQVSNWQVCRTAQTKFALQHH